MPLRLSPHALTVLQKRFLARDAEGQTLEDPEGLFRRAANAIAAVDKTYGDCRPEESADVFFQLMSSLRFLPNSPTLMNAGIERGQLSGCFVLPIEDSMESIYGTLRDAALIQKSGGGTGFSFSRLRPRGDYIRSTRGVSSGPLSFMRLYDYSTQINRLGGTRAGANMAVLRCDHPDVGEFITAKREPESLNSFNLSVMATDDFMRAVESGADWPLRFAGETRSSTNARALFSDIVQNAWASGDPGLLFFDRMNEANPTPCFGDLEATNPCGEQPLLANESCNLGSIDVSKYVRGESVDYPELRATIGHAVHFLDNVIDANFYPVEAVRTSTLRNRKIGLGIMGFADLLIALGIPYGSDAAVSLASDLMRFVQEEAGAASVLLAASRGPFPAFAQSRLAAQKQPPRRNACVTSIAPTGTISLLAGCSSGIEPLFALSYRREILDSTKTVDVHPALVEALGSSALLEKVRQSGHLPSIGVDPALKQIFATAHEIAPEWHIRMQAAFQRHTETGVSKTINLPNSATASDVRSAYELAFSMGCKGITVFRDGSKTNQILTAGHSDDVCPDCGELLINESGCRNCAACGYSLCTI
jgi:ribonucleoside-diphosphate reductase alpha chain